MDSIFGNDIYNLIVSYFNDFYDISIFCKVCKSMRYHAYVHNIYLNKSFVSYLQKIPILNINLVSMDNIPSQDLTLDHCINYKELQMVSLVRGLIDYNTYNILSILQKLCILKMKCSRINFIPITNSMTSLEWTNCIPMQCRFIQTYNNIIALHLDHFNFNFTSIHITYFPNLEYLYIKDNSQNTIIKSISLSRAISDLSKLRFLYYENIILNHKDLSKLKKLEYLCVGNPLRIMDLPIMPNILYLGLDTFEYTYLEYNNKFPNLIYFFNDDITYISPNIILWNDEKHLSIKKQYYMAYFDKR